MITDIKSPVDELLSCNRSPTIEETEFVIAAIQRSETKLATIDTAIIGARDVLERLSAEHEMVWAEMRAQRSVLSPIRRVPPELISEIFVLALLDKCHYGSHKYVVDGEKLLSRQRHCGLSSPSPSTQR